MNVAALRHKIVLQKPVETKDEVGGIVTTWSDIDTVWAAIEPLSGREAFNTHMTFAEATHKVTIRYLSGLTTKSRVVFGDRTFDINSIVNPSERNEQLILTCTEKLNG